MTVQITKTTGYPHGLLNPTVPLPMSRYTLVQETAQDIMYTPMGKELALMGTCTKTACKYVRMQEDAHFLAEASKKALTMRLEQNPELKDLLASSGSQPIVYGDTRLVAHLTLLRGVSVLSPEGMVFSEDAMRKLYKGTIDMFVSDPSSLLNVDRATLTLESLRAMVKASGNWPSTSATAAVAIPEAPVTGVSVSDKVVMEHSASVYATQKMDFERSLLIRHLLAMDPAAAADVSHLVSRMDARTRAASSRLAAMYHDGLLDSAVTDGLVPPDQRLLEPMSTPETPEVHAPQDGMSFEVPHVLTFAGGPVKVDGHVYDTPLHYAYNLAIRRMFADFGEGDLDGVHVSQVSVVYSDMLDKWIDAMYPQTLRRLMTEKFSGNQSCLAVLLSTDGADVKWTGRTEEESFMISDMMGQIKTGWIRSGPPSSSPLSSADIAGTDFFYGWLSYMSRTYATALSVISETTLARLLDLPDIPEEVRQPTDREQAALGSNYVRSAWRVCYSEFVHKFEGKNLFASVDYCVKTHLKALKVSRNSVTGTAKTLSAKGYGTLISLPVIRLAMKS
ncbi:hypothetical protein [Tiger frog virus]|uniref:Surface protein n=1 Tax=Rana tigrina ranavirus TaxID=160691 RepID=A0A6M8PD23_RTRV|nr:hypothetical protein [Tiger frog virus]